MFDNLSSDDFYNEVTKKNIGVYTKEEQKKLQNSRVIIFGLGGVGGMEAILCARSGIGHISGVDPDIFELSNINRQMIAMTSTMNKSKSESTEKYLKDINPFLSTNFHNVRVTEDNVDELIKSHDLVLEALDDMPSRIVVHRAAKKHGIPSISMSGSPPHRGFVSSFFPNGISYEDALNIPTKGKSISDEEVTSFVHEIKKKEHSILLLKELPSNGQMTFVKVRLAGLSLP